MSAMSTVVSATHSMTIDAFSCEEIKLEKNPNNHNRNTKNRTSAKAAQRVQRNSNRKPSNKSFESEQSCQEGRKLSQLCQAWSIQACMWQENCRWQLISEKILGINGTIIKVTNYGRIGTKAKITRPRIAGMETTKLLVSLIFKLLFLPHIILRRTTPVRTESNWMHS